MGTDNLLGRRYGPPGEHIKDGVAESMVPLVDAILVATYKVVAEGINRVTTQRACR
jgi:hypothetical protein